MNAKVQIIEANGKPQYAVIPYPHYVRLIEAAEMQEDIAEYDRIKARIERGEEEWVSAKMVDRLAGGENPLLVWREYRGLTQSQLAETAGVGQSYIAMIEKGERRGSVTKLSAIARALKVNVDDLIPSV